MSLPSTDVEAFIERHWRAAAWIANRRAIQAGWRGDPSEVESDAILGLWKAARTWRPDGGLTQVQWTRRHVENSVTDGLRFRHGRIGHRGNASLYSASLHLDAPAGDEGASMTLAETLVDDTSFEDSALDRVRLARALGTLTDQRRQIAIAYYWQGAKISEIGAVLDVTEGRVSQILREIRTALKAALSPTPLRSIPAPTSPKIRPTKSYVAICKYCAEPFQASRSDARYCRTTHRQAAYRAQVAARPL